MIELTPEQRQAVAQGEPVRIVDETTHDAYVLVRAEVFERMAGVVQPPPAGEVSSPIPPAMLRSQQAFWRDLPGLLKSRRNRGQWVAYHGDERVGLGKTRTELYRHCLGRGLRPGEFYIGRGERTADPSLGADAAGRIALRVHGRSFVAATGLMTIIDRLPLLPRPKTFPFGGRHVTFLRDEIVIWISIGLPGERDPGRLSPPFPGLIDSGNNSEFYLHEHHLAQWAGIRPAGLAPLESRRVNKRDVRSYEADVWIYPNLPGTQERWSGKAPFRLELEQGVAIEPPLPDQSIFPRVPLLGFSALRNNNLDFWFDSKAAQCHVWAAGWRSKAMRLLSWL